MKRFQRLLLATALLFGSVLQAQPNERAPRPAASAPLLLHVADAEQAVRLTHVMVDSIVVGRTARTTVELTFHNPNSRVLEGELQFPLLERQQVTGFSLDFDGQWRAAVPVEKARGQEVFEDITRAQVDPALLEATQGKHYKLRVYPIPAQGQRRVSLSISEQLSVRADRFLVLRLPLTFAQPSERLDFRLRVPGLKAASLPAVKGLGDGMWQDEAGSAVLRLQRLNGHPTAAAAIAEIAFPAALAAPVTVEEFDGKRYFYTETTAPKVLTAARPRPASLAIVWDASGSGAQRDHRREFALLDAYFRALGTTRVDLTLARDSREDGGTFIVKGGDWSALRAALEKLSYDGATNLAAFQPSAPSDAILLFTDGLGNFSERGLPDYAAPLFAVSAAAGADNDRLRFAATRSGGVFVDLTTTAPASAADSLQRLTTRLLGVQSSLADELITTPLDPDGRRVAIAGVLRAATATLTLSWRHPNGAVERQLLDVSSQSALPAKFAAQTWAGLQLAQLLPERSVNRQAIERLGKTFALVTPGTSLIVLDRVEDYVRYDIVPPVEWRSEYERLVTARQQSRERERSRHLDDIARRFREKQAWWERDFPKDERRQVREEAKNGVGAVNVGGAPAAINRPLPAAPAAPAAAPLLAESRQQAKSAAPAQRVAEPAAARDAAESTASPAAARIALRKWTPDSPYANRLRNAPKQDLYRVYLDERPGYLNSTAFFLDAADLFFERGEPALALRILSNLAEMDLENRHLLRILAYRLQQAKRADLAVPILRRVVELAPNEPQSWRDLGLALADTGARQQAVDALLQVVTRPWHNRFPDIELIALAEMNALIATAPQTLDRSAIDPRFLRNLPLDLRVVLSWDADNTDIDLWVTDPNGERSYYANRLSYQGGAMSRDFTGGYGPEEYSLKRAKPGRYLIQAQFYGHRQQVVAGATTLNVRLYSGFGTSGQKEEQITLRLKGQREVVTVGEFIAGE